MIRLRSKTPYWEKFSSYQTFETVKEMNALVKRFNQMYTLTPAVKAVLNTLKLHSKTYVGVCWLYKEEIAKKAKVSISSVTRATKELKEIGILTIHENMHTKRGGQTHNVYVINPTFQGFEDEASDQPDELPQKEQKETPNADVPTVSASEPQTHKNLNKNSNTNLKDLSIKIDDTSIAESEVLKHVPNEFIDLLEPFYGHSPKIIRDRWKTVCSAVKRNCVSMTYTSWDTIGEAWNGTVKALKRGKIKRATDDGIGAYFYGTLCDYLFNDFVRNGSVQA